MPLDITGYNTPTLEEVIESGEESVRSNFGPTTKTSEDSQLGHIIGVFAIEEHNLYQDIQALYNNMTAATAIGKALDNAVLHGGLTRKEETPSTVLMTFSGDVGTSIPAGTEVRSEIDSTVIFLTDEATSISAAGTVSVEATAPNNAKYGANKGTVTVLPTEINGVDSITNNQDASVGSELETDTELRSRFFSGVSIGGNGTGSALGSALDQISGVTSVNVIQNRTGKFQDRGEGVSPRPPKSVECVVEGGSSDEISKVILLVKAGTTEAFGNTIIPVADADGRVEQVGFTRPEAFPITISITYEIYDEEVFPFNGEEEIKIAVQAFGVTEYSIGKDVIVNRLFTPVFSIPGLRNVTIKVAEGQVPQGSLSLGTDDLLVELFEKVQLNNSFIFLQQIT